MPSATAQAIALANLESTKDVPSTGTDVTFTPVGVGTGVMTVDTIQAPREFLGSLNAASMAAATADALGMGSLRSYEHLFREHSPQCSRLDRGEEWGVYVTG